LTSMGVRSLILGLRQLLHSGEPLLPGIGEMLDVGFRHVVVDRERVGVGAAGHSALLGGGHPRAAHLAFVLLLAIADNADAVGADVLARPVLHDLGDHAADVALIILSDEAHGAALAPVALEAAVAAGAEVGAPVAEGLFAKQGLPDLLAGGVDVDG